MKEKNLPNNLEAEESVLGACFLSKYALQKASESLTEESFYSERNAKIFSTMLSLQDEKTPIDITTVTSYLKRKISPENKLIFESEILIISLK